jgi:uncharacterized LabA/DUF88 family protein
MSTLPAPEIDHNKSRVYSLIDGFNLYHAIDKFAPGVDEADQRRYQKYKWICLRTLIQQFLLPEEQLVGVHYFTAYPNWDQAKMLRHQTYVNAIHARGVDYTLGEFKPKLVDCRATCRQSFEVKEEKQTDVNIATKMIELADHYDKLILLTADSDQVPAVRLLLKLHPTKKVFVLPPIGRNSKELVRAAGKNRLVMTEEHLGRAILPNPVDIVRDGKMVAQLWKPATWVLPEGNPPAIQNAT